MEKKLIKILQHALDSKGPIVVMTGAGISAESGIPTFRGKEGYWTVGAKEYHPQEMATNRMFRSAPEEVWQWYLYRRGICRQALPNTGHKAIVKLEEVFRDRFLLLTQNVDGLHLRSGNSQQRTYEIHGNIDYMRCVKGCCSELFLIPEAIGFKKRSDSFNEKDRGFLVCPQCDGPTRPHVLWFDECYDEKWYRFESSLKAAAQAAMLIVIGTSGATNLPMQVGSIVSRRGASMIDINPQSNPFSDLAERSTYGFFAKTSSGKILPSITGT